MFSAFGEVFANIGVREPQPQASEVFTTFGEAHRSIERYAIKMLKTVKPVLTSSLEYLLALSKLALVLAGCSRKRCQSLFH